MLEQFSMIFGQLQKPIKVLHEKNVLRRAAWNRLPGLAMAFLVPSQLRSTPCWNGICSSQTSPLRMLIRTVSFLRTEHGNCRRSFLVRLAKESRCPCASPTVRKLGRRDRILMPENPTDGKFEESRIHTRSIHLLNQDQVHGITGSGRTESARPGPSPVDHREREGRLDPDQDQGITGRQTRCRLDPDQIHGITGSQAMQAQPGPKPVGHWEHTGRRADRRSKGDGRWESKNLCSTCEQGCCGQSAASLPLRLPTNT